jgi:hypothetical protein
MAPLRAAGASSGSGAVPVSTTGRWARQQDDRAAMTDDVDRHDPAVRQPDQVAFDAEHSTRKDA